MLVVAAASPTLLPLIVSSGRLEHGCCFHRSCSRPRNSTVYIYPQKRSSYTQEHSPVESKKRRQKVLAKTPLPKKVWLVYDLRYNSIGYFSSSFHCLSQRSMGKAKCYKQVEDVEEFECLQWKLLSSMSWASGLLSSRGLSMLVGFGNVVRCSWQGMFKLNVFNIIIRLVVGMMLLTTVSVSIDKTRSWALTEENLLFLEAWRTVDRAYVDKTFNGQSWFRYRENALRNEPMNTREETYEAIKKMLSTLDDPFTRFLEPEKFKSLRSGTQGALTGVGLSIGYPLALNDSVTGLVVVSASPGGPADRAGILPGDVILAIDDASTEAMDIYDAATRLQGTEGSSVKLSIRKGTQIKDMVLGREKVTLNPVKSRVCEITRSGIDNSKIGYIKLTSFNQNASGAVKDAIEKMRSNGVKSFVLDLRNNSGGLFPEGIEIAKIWLDKGVIVYICDNRGVRDIYEADGSNTIAASEPLAVLVNKGTASASEILAGALKDNKRAVLFGEPTYGKGKIQSVFELSDGSGLAVTVARYETPAHTDINKVGIIPDHALPTPFPMDEDEFCGCLRDSTSPCSLSAAQLFSR